MCRRICYPGLIALWLSKHRRQSKIWPWYPPPIGAVLTYLLFQLVSSICITHWGQIWWWWWRLQLLEAAGHQITSVSLVTVQLDNYLSSVSTSVECLASYPHVTMPSSKLIQRWKVWQQWNICSAQLDRSRSAAGTVSCLTNISIIMFVFLQGSKKCELWIVHSRHGNLFEKQFDVCVFKRFPKHTLYFTDSLFRLIEHLNILKKVLPETWIFSLLM